MWTAATTTPTLWQDSVPRHMYALLTAVHASYGNISKLPRMLTSTGVPHTHHVFNRFLVQLCATPPRRSTNAVALVQHEASTIKGHSAAALPHVRNAQRAPHQLSVHFTKPHAE